MKLLLTLLGLVLAAASNAQLLQNTATGTQLGGSSVTGTAITNGFTPAASLAGGLTVPSLTVTGAAPGTVTLNDASGNLRLVLGTNDHWLISNALTGWIARGTNGGITLSSNLVAAVVYANISSGGSTNSALTAGAVMLTDANKAQASLANGGANTVLHGTSPPTETQVVESDFGFTDVLTANASTSAHGLVKKLPNDATKYYDGTGNYTVPAGGSAGAPTTIVQTNFVLNTVYTNGSQAIQAKAKTFLHVAAVAGGVAEVDLYADQVGGTTFSKVDACALDTTVLSIVMDYTNCNLICDLSPSATYYFTNTSTGTGNTGALLAGTGQTITISSGTNGPTGATGPAGTFPLTSDANIVFAFTNVGSIQTTGAITSTSGQFNGNGAGLTNLLLRGSSAGGTLALHANAGSGATIQYTGSVTNDTHFTIQIVTGGSPAVGTFFTNTFSAPFKTPPFVSFPTPKTAVSSQYTTFSVNSYITNVTTTGFEMGWGAVTSLATKTLVLEFMVFQ